jgi:hypothetical protein
MSVVVALQHESFMVWQQQQPSLHSTTPHAPYGGRYSLTISRHIENFPACVLDFSLLHRIEGDPVPAANEE